jgi:2-dehydro-3-deoxy-L-rhamnonate dehydrogenase (NAD+)
MNQIDMKDRCAVVTGGASGIGLAIAQRFVASGARVALWDVDAGKAADAARGLGGASAGAGGAGSSAGRLGSSAGAASGGEHHLGVGVDVTDEAAVVRATDATMKAFGRIDALVCSAGITGPNATMIDYPADAWRQVFEVNVHGLFLCNRVVAKRMLERDYGRIVNIASVAGKEGNPNASAYSASKAAVIGLTKSLGKELAKSGVRVNCITPAAVKTPMFEQMTQQHIDFMLSKIPMARFGLIEEIAAMVAWLSSEECSFSTGAVFDLSGGRATY